MADPSVLLFHAFVLLAHGGQLSEDCAYCSEIITQGKTVEALLEGQAEARDAK